MGIALDSPGARAPLPRRGRRRDLRDDPPGPQARRFDVGDRILSDAALFLIEIEDRRAIARPDVVALRFSVVGSWIR